MAQASRATRRHSLEDVLIDRLRSPVQLDRDVGGVVALDVEDGDLPDEMTRLIRNFVRG